jgi:hypothetical protein
MDESTRSRLSKVEHAIIADGSVALCPSGRLYTAHTHEFSPPFPVQLYPPSYLRRVRPAWLDGYGAGAGLEFDLPPPALAAAQAQRAEVAA